MLELSRKFGWKAKEDVEITWPWHYTRFLKSIKALLWMAREKEYLLSF